MTRAARADDLCVVDRKYWRKHVGIVAVLADIRCLYVCWSLADRFHAVMAADAIVGDIRVSEVCW